MTVRRLKVQYTIQYPDGDVCGPFLRIMTERKFLRLLDDYDRIGCTVGYEVERIE